MIRLKYEFNRIERKWQDRWAKENCYHAETGGDKPKFYALVEFPYPSGQGLHVGHARPYTAMDVVARKRRMDGYNVLFPMGYDAFGLPTENYAIKNHIHPAKVTHDNIANFTKQLKMLGYSVNENSEKALNEVRDVLIKQKQDGIVQGYMVDEVKEKMISGEAAMAVMWSGDAMYAIMGNDSLKYVVPEEGSNVWVDGMCIPKNAQNPDAAHKFIDFLCRPDIAYRNFECIYYASPITAVQDMMSEEDLANPALNPSEEALSHDITENLDYYNRIWIDILA